MTNSAPLRVGVELQTSSEPCAEARARIRAPLSDPLKYGSRYGVKMLVKMLRNYSVHKSSKSVKGESAHSAIDQMHRGVNRR